MYSLVFQNNRRKSLRFFPFCFGTPRNTFSGNKFFHLLGIKSNIHTSGTNKIVLHLECIPQVFQNERKFIAALKFSFVLKHRGINSRCKNDFFCTLGMKLLFLTKFNSQIHMNHILQFQRNGQIS